MVGPAEGMKEEGIMEQVCSKEGGGKMKEGPLFHPLQSSLQPRRESCDGRG